MVYTYLQPALKPGSIYAKSVSPPHFSPQNQDPLFSEDLSRIFLTLPVKHGGHRDFHHITMLSKKSRSDPVEVHRLTYGNWEVTRIVSYDEIKNIIYFLSSEEASQQRHLYSLLINGSFPRQCLTCGLKKGCTFFDVDISPNAQNAILYCQGPGVPAVLLLSFSDLDSYFILESNLLLQSALDTRKMTEIKIQNISDDNFGLPLKLIYPPDFSDAYLYGLLLIV
ncbi:hypothetical protein XENORESO_011300 [Xenotaenia resolanae]|uniref:Dipeptidylpeptidase IV N-terminal domain-containing protein n=1 Tax=Xenotaenia resolanae TaxID=208358 RepID=A0ABV0W2D5_9TELE